MLILTERKVQNILNATNMLKLLGKKVKQEQIKSLVNY